MMNISLIDITNSDTSALGLRSLSACLKQAGHQVQMIFLANAGEKRGTYLTFCPEHMLNQVSDLCRDADVVGVSFLTSGFHRAVQISERLKNTTKAKIFWGGIHATVEPEQCLNYVDGICRGEGEEAFLELLQRMSAGQDFYDTRNFWFKLNGNIIKNDLRPLTQNLDNLPFIDYEISGANFVFDHDKKMFFPLDKDRFIKIITPEAPRTIMGFRPVFTTMATRGCPQSCAFCFHSIYRQMYGRQRYIRKRSPGNVVAELSKFKTDYDFHGFIWFADDDLLVYSTTELREFAELYKKEIGLPFFCLGGPSSILEKKMEYLTDAGLRDFQFGIQTGSTKTKKMYHRSFTLQNLIKDTLIINKFKDKIPLPCYDFILDNPWETVDDELETLDLILQLPKPYKLALASFRFFPGSVLYEDAKSAGVISIDSEQIYWGEFLKFKGTYVSFLIGLYNYLKIPKPIIRLLSHPTLVRMLDTKTLAPVYGSFLSKRKFFRSLIRKFVPFFRRSSVTPLP